MTKKNNKLGLSGPLNVLHKLESEPHRMLTSPSNQTWQRYLWT